MLSQLMMLFGFFALILILVYWVNRAVVLFDQLIADGQSIGVFLTFTTLSLPSLVRIVVPVAAFAATVYVTNRMTTESELVVVQASGFSALRLARPVAYFGLIITGLMLVLTHFLVPISTSELNKRQLEIAQNAGARLLRDGQFLTPTEGVTVYIREITPNGELHDIFLSDSRSDVETVTYTAASAFIVRSDAGPQLVMVEGMAQTFRRDSRRLITTSFTDLAYNLGALVTLPDVTRRSDREVMTWELLSPSTALAEETGRSMGQLYTLGHERFSQAFQALVTALIGFSALMLGGHSRFGIWRQILFAIFLVILIKVVESFTTRLISSDPMLWPLTYVPTLLGFIIAFALLSFSIRPVWMFRRRRKGAVA